MENKTSRYFKYAIGEIVLVVIGILIALQINNWNEDKKAKKAEHYVLQEVLNNLKEDGSILQGIIDQRQRAKESVERMIGYLNQPQINKDSLEADMLNFLTFERYFPINNGYEIGKSKGLELSNNALTTKISRYYDYEQLKMNRSIIDIENAILEILEDTKSISRFIQTLTLRQEIELTNYNDPQFKKELNTEIVAFKNNNVGTLMTLQNFLALNKSLQQDIENELKK